MLSIKYRDRRWLYKHSLITGLLSFLLIFIGFYYLDQKIAYFFKKPELENFYIFSREITNIGYSIHYFIIAIIGIIISKYFYKKIPLLTNKPLLNKAIYGWSLFIIKCLILIGLFGEILKIIFGRQRPHSTENFENLNFIPFSTHWHWHSFPSGHTQVIFTMATIILLIWPKHRICYFILAIFLGFTRVVIHQHFFSDFIAGAFLGYIATLWIYFLWPPKIN